MSESNKFIELLLGQATLSDPIRYGNLVKAAKSAEIADIKKLLPDLKLNLIALEDGAKKTNDLRKQVSGEGYARRKKDQKKVFEQAEIQTEGRQNISVVDIIAYHYESMSSIYSTMIQGLDYITSANFMSISDGLERLNTSLSSVKNELGDDRVASVTSKLSEVTADALSSLNLEQQMNKGASTAFYQGLMLLEEVPRMYEMYLMQQSRNVEFYFEKLKHRHTNGTVICNLFYKSSLKKSPTLTDLSILVWDNIDKVGEIESGNNQNELSAYTLNRAGAMIEACKNDVLWGFMLEPTQELAHLATKITPIFLNVHRFVVNMKHSLGESAWKLSTMNLDNSCKEFCNILDSLDPDQITQKESDRTLSRTEKFMMDHRNKSIQRVADLLSQAVDFSPIVEEILKLKIEERNFFINENSFYVTKIGNGNMFTGEAPGQLEVIPGEKPVANLEYIWGEGFSEIKDFILGMKEAKRWNPLFLSTSPSKTTDKNNILLVGPGGCGKTELLRSLAASDDSISIFTTGSAFGTAWANESQKNVKKLFDAALNLHKSSGKQVHILIDEIDDVLNNDRSSTKLNLSLEFQNMMDGVIAYPGLTVWGATNHPERIPTPMLRRFAKVRVVGELSTEDTTSIMKHYIENFLPHEEFSAADYLRWSTKLAGATGDVIRKSVDEVWLDLMRGFISDHKEQAEKILDYIKEQHGDTFDVSMLTAEDRTKIKEMITESGVKVTVDLVNSKIENLLNNSAVQQQIHVAKETYKKAKSLLSKQKRGKESLGFGH